MRHMHVYHNAYSPWAELGKDHWPTEAEYVALHKARDAVLRDGKGSYYDCKVMDGSDHVARVAWEGKSGQYGSMIISYNAVPVNTITIHKQWVGVPEPDQSVFQRRFFHTNLPDAHFRERG